MAERVLLKWTVKEPTKNFTTGYPKVVFAIVSVIFCFYVSLATVMLVSNFNKYAGNLYLILVFVVLWIIYAVETFKKYQIIEYIMTDEAISSKFISKSKFTNLLVSFVSVWQRITVRIFGGMGASQFYTLYKSISRYEILDNGHIFIVPKVLGYKSVLVPKNNKSKIISILKKKGINKESLS